MLETAKKLKDEMDETIKDSMNYVGIDEIANADPKMTSLFTRVVRLCKLQGDLLVEQAELLERIDKKLK